MERFWCLPDSGIATEANFKFTTETTEAREIAPRIFEGSDAPTKNVKLTQPTQPVACPSVISVISVLNISAPNPQPPIPNPRY
jgi:hypothetical protein